MARHFVAWLLLPLVALAAGCAAASPAVETTDVVAQVPLQDGESYRYELSNAEGELLGIGVLTTSREGDRYVLEQSYFRAGDDPSVVVDRIRVEVDAATLKPYSGDRVIDRAALGDELRSETYTWEYMSTEDGPQLQVTRSVETADGETNSDTEAVDLREHYYDNESSLWFWRGIPFAAGYEAHYVSANPIEGNRQTVSIEVVQQETIEVPAGTFETWRVLVRTGRAARSAWINVDAPHQVVQWDNGSQIYRLASVSDERPASS